MTAVEKLLAQTKMLSHTQRILRRFHIADLVPSLDVRTVRKR